MTGQDDKGIIRSAAENGDWGPPPRTLGVHTAASNARVGRQLFDPDIERKPVPREAAAYRLASTAMAASSCVCSTTICAAIVRTAGVRAL